MPKFTDLLEDENGSVANMGEQPSPPACKKNERGFEEDDDPIIGNEMVGVMDDLSAALVDAMADVIRSSGGIGGDDDLDDVLPDEREGGEEGDHDTDNVPTDIYKDDDQTMNDHPSNSEVSDDENGYGGGDTERDPDSREGPLNDEPANDEPPFIDDEGHNGKGEEGEGNPDENDIKDDDMKDKDTDEELMDDSAADDHEDRLSDLEDHVFGKKKKTEEDGPSPYQQDTY